jgi:hypothetical protein
MVYVPKHITTAYHLLATDERRKGGGGGEKEEIPILMFGEDLESSNSIKVLYG